MVKVSEKGLVKAMWPYFLLFILISMIIAPLINEAMVAYALNFFSCDFTYTYNMDMVRGFHIISNPLCNLEDDQKIFLFGLGPLVNILLAIMFFFGSIITREYNMHRSTGVFTMSSLGFFSFPILLSLSGEGELYEVFNLLGEQSLWMIPVLGAILLSLAIIFFYTQMKHFYSIK
jgi:hypothetical protein